MWCVPLGRDKREPATMNTYAIDSNRNAAVHITTMAAADPAPVSSVPLKALPIPSARTTNDWPGATARLALPEYQYILFNKSSLQLRLIGARGGRAYGRNQRARRALMATQQEAATQRAAPGQTTAEAVAVLDARFPWLRGVEQRRSRDRPSPLFEAH
jgi:hypothetical protein